MALFTTALFATALAAGTISAFWAGAIVWGLNALAGVGLSLLANALLGGSKKPTSVGVKQQVTVGEEVPRSIIMGYRMTAGHFVYGESWGKVGKTPNAYQTRVFKLCDMPVADSGLAGIFVNRARCTLLTGEPETSIGLGVPVEEYRIGVNDHLWVKFYDGSQTECDPFLLATFGGLADRPWREDMVGVGICYVVVTALIHEERMRSWPELGYELAEGIPLYDRRKDSTAGGDGSHRADDPDTWEPSSNPIVQSANIARGIYYGDEWMYGGQSIGFGNRIQPSFETAADACDASTSIPGGSEPWAEAGLEIPVNAVPLDVIGELLAACAGRMYEGGGVFDFQVGPPGSPIAAFVTKDDVLSTQGASFRPVRPLAGLVNGVVASYPDPGQAWAMRAAPPLYNEDYEAIDDDRRLPVSVDLVAVTSGTQVQRLASAALAEARRFRQWTGALGARAWPYKPGDVITLDDPDLGFDEKLFRLDGVALSIYPVWLLTEVDPDDYDPPDYTTPPDPASLAPVVPAPQAVVDPDFVGVIIIVNGQRRPAGRATWDADVEDVVAVAIQIEAATTGELVHSTRTDDVTAAELYFTHGMIPGAEFRGRLKYIPGTNRATTWSEWIGFTVPDVRTEWPDLSPVLHADVTAARLMAREMFDRLDELRLGLDEGLQSSFDYVEQMRFQVSAVAGELSSSVTLQLIALADADTALAALIAAVEATAENAETEAIAAQAAVTTEASARVTADTALASSITSVSAQVNHASTGLPAAHASITAEAIARADADEAIVGTIESLEAVVTDEETGLEAAHAAITSEATARAAADEAIAGTVETIEATLNDEETGLAAAHAAVVTEAGARATADTAIAATVTTLSAQVNHETTGLPAAHAAVSSEATTRATADTALANAIDTVEATIDDEETGLEAAHAAVVAEASARATADSAIAEDVTTVTAELDGVTAEALFRMTAVTAPEGISVAMAWQGRITTETGYTSGGIFLYLAPDLSIIKLVANQVLVRKGGVDYSLSDIIDTLLEEDDTNEVFDSATAGTPLTVQAGTYEFFLWAAAGSGAAGGVGGFLYCKRTFGAETNLLVKVGGNAPAGGVAGITGIYSNPSSPTAIAIVGAGGGAGGGGGYGGAGGTTTGQDGEGGPDEGSGAGGTSSAGGAGGEALADGPFGTPPFSEYELVGEAGDDGALGVGGAPAEGRAADWTAEEANNNGYSGSFEDYASPQGGWGGAGRYGGGGGGSAWYEDTLFGNSWSAGGFGGGGGSSFADGSCTDVEHIRGDDPDIEDTYDLPEYVAGVGVPAAPLSGGGLVVIRTAA